MKVGAGLDYWRREAKETAKQERNKKLKETRALESKQKRPKGDVKSPKKYWTRSNPIGNSTRSSDAMRESEREGLASA